MRLPMSSPDVAAGEIEALVETVKGGTLSLGPRLQQFESAVAGRVGVANAVGVNSGTSGLHLAVLAAEIHDGDVAITSPFSFVASANCLLYERARPIFVDVEPCTGNLDPARVDDEARRIASSTEARRLKAIIPIHTFGQPCDMDPIVEIARKRSLIVIEDACEALGADYKGRPAGSFGDAAVFAFYPNKQITTGEGGMIVTSRADWAALFRSLRNQGRDVFDAWLKHSRLGYNYRLDEMSAALGVSQMHRLDELLDKRRRVAGWYSARLDNMADLVAPPRPATTTTRMSWFVYVVRLAGHVDRNWLMVELEGRGVPTRPYFTPIHLQPFYRQRFGFAPGDFPIAEDLGRRSLALPFSGVMTEEQVDYVCRQLESLLDTVVTARA